MGKLGDKHDQHGAGKNSKVESTLRHVDETLDEMDGAMDEISHLDGSVCGEVQTLVWALVDDYLDEPGLRRLEALILDSAEARNTYVRCIQLHVDLIYYFAEQRRANDPNSTGLPFPLPAELQQMLQKDAGKTNGNSNLTQCRARRQPSRLQLWLRSFNRRVDDLLLALNWNVQYVLERI